MQSMGFSQATNIFPIKLWQLVNDREIDAIKWNDQGDGIIINKNLIRENFLCLNGFKASNSMSFVRQLNAYGFKKSRRSNRDDHNIHYYFHHNFQQNQPELLSFVKRCYQRSRVNAKNDQKKDLTNRWRDHRNLYDPLDDPRSVNLHNNPLLPQAIAMNIFSVNHDHSYQKKTLMKIDQLQDQRSTGGTELHQAPPGYTVPDPLLDQEIAVVTSFITSDHSYQMETPTEIEQIQDQNPMKRPELNLSPSRLAPVPEVQQELLPPPSQPLHDLEVGDWIMVKTLGNKRKQQVRWVGPHQVLQTSHNAVMIAEKAAWLDTSQFKKISEFVDQKRI